MKSKSSIKKEFDAFASRIARLESLRQQLDSLDVSGFEREADLIRAQLNDVNSIPASERALSDLRDKIRHKKVHVSVNMGNSKLAAQTRELKAELKQDTGALKRKIAALEQTLEHKKQISAKKQLSSKEVAFVKDLPNLERELHSLRREFEQHNKFKHVKVDAGVGRLVNTNFDDFIQNIKTELTERLKSKELSMDSQLASDLQNREKVFSKRYQHLVDEFHQRYKDKVNSELQHEVKKEFAFKLHKKLDEERKRIVDRLVQSNMKRLSEQRHILIKELEGQYRLKEAALKKQLSREKAITRQELSQRNAALNAKLKSFLVRENTLKKKSDRLSKLVAKQKDIFDAKEENLNVAKARLESRLKDKEKDMVRALNADKSINERQLMAAKGMLERKAHQIAKQSSDRERQKLAKLKEQEALLLQERNRIAQEKDKMHKEIAMLKKHEKDLLSSSAKRMQQELDSQTQSNTHEFNKRVLDMKERMKQDLRDQMNVMRRENEMRIAKEIRNKETILRTKLDREYESKLKSTLARKEQELERKKALLEKSMMSHISKVFS